MIHKPVKQSIINILGKKYTPAIVEYLSKHKVYNTAGTPYTAHYIRKIVNGVRENKEVEARIIRLMEKTHRDNLRQQAKLSQFKKTKSTVKK